MSGLLYENVSNRKIYVAQLGGPSPDANYRHLELPGHPSVAYEEWEIDSTLHIRPRADKFETRLCKQGWAGEGMTVAKPRRQKVCSPQLT